MSNVRRLRAGALCFVFAASTGVLLAEPASADPPGYASDPKVGTIYGGYSKAPVRDYHGYAFPAEGVGQCVIVERKLRSGGWSDGFVETGRQSRCNLFDWRISNDTAVANTVAIRLRVYSGKNAPNSYVNLCSSKSECLAM